MHKINFPGFINGILLCATLFYGCTNDELQENEKGRLAFNIQLDAPPQTPVVTRSTDERDYKLNIRDSKGNTIREFTHQTDIPEELWLPGGDYTLSVSSGENVAAAFENPFYYGTENVSIIPNAVTNKSIVCTLTNTKISVHYSDRIKKYFQNPNTLVGNTSGSLTFTETTVEAGFFKITGTEADSITWNLSVTNSKGKILTRQGKFLPEARNYYRINFDIDDPATEEGGMLNFQIIVNEDTRVIENTVSDTMLAIPLILGNGFKLSEQQFQLFHQSEGIILTITGEPELTSIKVIHDCEYLTDQGISPEFDLKKIANPTFLNSLGVNWNDQDKSTTLLDLDALLNQLPDPADGSYNLHFRIRARSVNGKEWEEELNLLILKSDVMTLETKLIADIWATRANIYGKWVGSGAPTGITFQYQVAGGSDETNNIWQETEEITPATDGTFEVELTGLTDGTTYNYRAKAGGIPANKYNLTTEKIINIPNLSFDTWAKSGSNWFANAEATDSYWASGNPGVTSALAGSKPANSIPEESDVVKGKAAKLTTLGGVTMVGVAAGNLFTGTYKTNPTKPALSVNFGRDYNGARPTKLSGWYKYISCKIDHPGNPSDLTDDQGHIYIWLKNGGGEQIAYGELVIKESTSDYIHFEIPIIYSNPESIPAKIAIIATSSKYGGDFNNMSVSGAVGTGSTLWIDEFELSY